MGIIGDWLTKEGPGVEKDAPQKKGVARFFEIATRDFSTIWTVSLLTFLCFVPSILSAIFTALFYQYILFVGAGALLFLLSSLLVGPALCGLNAVIITRVRDIPCFMMHEYKKAWKNNYKQSMPAGVVIMVLIAMEVIVGYNLITFGDSTSSLLLGIVLLSLVLIISSAHLIMLQILFINLPLIAIIKNSIIMSLAYLVKMFGAALVFFAVIGAMAFFWVFWPIYVLLGIIGFLCVIVNMIAWPVMEKAFNVTEAQKEKRQKENNEN